MSLDPLSNKFFEILVRQNHRNLLAFGRMLTGGDGDLAEELVQDSLVVAFEKIPEFDQQRDFGAWVRGIIRNRYRQHCEKRHSQRATAIDLGDRLVAIDDEALEDLFVGLDSYIGGRQSVLAALEHCLASLSDSLREVIRLCYFGQLALDSVCTRLACTEAAVRKRLSRGRQLLHDCIQRRLQERSHSGRLSTSIELSDPLGMGDT